MKKNLTPKQMKEMLEAMQPVVNVHNDIENHIYVSINDIFWILVDFVFFFAVAILLGASIRNGDWWMVALNALLMLIIVWRRSR